MHTPDLFDGRTFATIEQGMTYAQELGFPDGILARGERAAEALLYAGDQHYFVDSSLPSYDPEATALLTQRVLDFLQTRG